MTIAASGGAIRAKRVRGADGKKIAAVDWARSAGLKAGDRIEFDIDGKTLAIVRITVIRAGK